MTLSLSKLDLLPHERISDAIFDRLRMGIIQHEIPAGFRLSIPALAKQLGTSRSPVHEAVKRLVQEGLATEEPRRGASVTVYNAFALTPVYEVRCVLEGLAASLAAERATPDMVQEMEEVLQSQEAAIARGDLVRHAETDIQFHYLVLRAAANPMLEELLGRVYERIKAAMVARVFAIGPAQALADHREVLSAIRDHDMAAAAKSARAHIVRIHTQMIARRLEAATG